MMCETIIFFIGAVCAGLLLWVVILDGRIYDYENRRNNDYK